MGEDGGEIIGVLPLQYNSDEGYLEFFGGSFMEDNHVLIKTGFEKYIPEFYKAIEGKAKLEDIAFDNDFFPMDFIENKYVIKLAGIEDSDNYLRKVFSSSTRRKIIKRNKAIEELPIEICYDEESDLDELIRLNKEAFGKESSFNKSFRREIYMDIMKSDFKTVTISAKIGGEKQNVSLAVVYKGVFVSFAVGNNKEEFPDLGHYMFLKRIEQAISLGCKVYDAGLGNLGWKEKWHLEKIPQFKFHLGIGE